VRSRLRKQDCVSQQPPNGEAIVEIKRCRDHEVLSREDTVAVEEPLEIFVDGAPCYLTMRSPGREKELAAGFCLSEGLIDSLRDVDVLTYCEEAHGNRVYVGLNAERRLAKGLTVKQRRLPAYSSCGMCGKELVEDICTQMARRANTFSVGLSDVREMLATLERSQEVFGETGGTHAAAVFDRSLGLLAVAEDIGRHNALDKAMGELVLRDRLDDVTAVALTSRLSYEMVQKVGRTGAEVLIGMSSPTSLGVELAKTINLTVIGFATQCRFNVYSGFARLMPEGEPTRRQETRGNDQRSL
jgi:FdhD protein